MPWIKLDDGFYRNPVNRRLGPAGRDLFVASIAHCMDGLTDGRIAKTDLPMLLAAAQAKRSLVPKLLEAGRWVEHADHYEVVDYLRYQPSKAKVLADREAAAARQRRARRHAVTSPVTNGVTSGVSHGYPDPTRPPLLDTSLGVTPSRGAEEPDQEGSADFEHHDRPRHDPAVAQELAGNVRNLRQSLHTPDDAA